MTGDYARALWLALFVLYLAVSIAGCQSQVPRDALALSPETLEQRQLQTRRFDGLAEEDILSASAAVLQDLGFNLDESETALGVLVASKQRTAREPMQVAASILLGVMGWEWKFDEKQRIRASLVTRPVAGSSPDSYYVRITFQRTVWDSEREISRIERVEDPALYQGFFDRLSKSIFLEAHKI